MNRAPVTRFLVIANTGIHILLVFWAISHPTFSVQRFYDTWGLVPADFWLGAVYQPLTSMFLHGGWLHLLVNMIALWSLGTAIEMTVGPSRFGLLYIFSGLTGALFVVVFQSNLGSPTVGASGAIMGLLAAIAIFYPRSEMLILFFPMKARTAAIVIGLISVLLALYDRSSGISHLGHLGGLIGGILYTKFVLQLDFLRNDLHHEQGTVFRMRRTPDPQAGLEAELRRVMEELQRERRGEAAPKPDSDPQSGWTQPEPFNEVIREEPQDSPMERRIYFDPVTGRFYVR